MKNISRMVLSAVIVAGVFREPEAFAETPVVKGPLGFQLSPDATATFAFKTIPYKSPALPCEAIVASKDDKTVFRVREGWIKSLPIEILSKKDGLCTIRATDLRTGDHVITTRLGFLRITEVILEEGASHSH